MPSQRQGESRERAVFEGRDGIETLTADLGSGDQGAVGHAECRDIQLESTRTVIQLCGACLGQHLGQIDVESDFHGFAAQGRVSRLDKLLRTGSYREQGCCRQEDI